VTSVVAAGEQVVGATDEGDAVDGREAGPVHQVGDVGDDDVVHVADLGRPGVLDAIEGAPEGSRIVGYASHVDRDLIARAEALGVDVHPRSRFFAQLTSLLA